MPLQLPALRWRTTSLLALFSIVNILNYADRGVVPGAFGSIQSFIRADLQVDSVDVFYGLLSTVYICGYGISSVFFGHAVHHYAKFRLVTIGLAGWCVSVILSATAPRYWVLLVARALSGVGEASFQCVIPPWIEDHAPPGRLNSWLAIFYTAIPFGTAIGYAYGGAIASAMSWRWAFALEVFPMLPLLVLMFLVPEGKQGQNSGAANTAGGLTVEQREQLVQTNMEGGTLPLLSAEGEETVETIATTRRIGQSDAAHGDGAMRVTAGVTPVQLQVDMELTPSPRKERERERQDRHDTAGQERIAVGDSYQRGLDEAASPSSAASAFARGGARAATFPAGADEAAEAGLHSTADATPPNLWTEVKTVMYEPVFVLVVLGYAAFTFVFSGLGSFGPLVVAGLGLFSTQASASFAFGACVSVAAILGTPIGGWLLDRDTKRALEKEQERLARAHAAATEASPVLSVFASGQRSSMGEEDGLVGGSSPKKTRNAAAGAGAGGVEATAGSALLVRGRTADDELRVSVSIACALWQATWITMVGTAFIAAGIALGAESGPLFMGAITLGCTMLCAITAGINLAMMSSVDPRSRAFAIGLGTLLVHAFGDVPAPTVIGAMADYLSPQTCTDPGDSSTCTRSAAGLQQTLGIVTAWLGWPILLWAIAYILAVRGLRRRDAREAASGPGIGERLYTVTRIG